MWIRATGAGYVSWSVDERVRALVTTRNVGGGDGATPTMNLSFLAGNDPASQVIQSRRQAAAWFSQPLEAMVFAEQVHGGNVDIVSQADRARGAATAASAVPATDGLLTRDSDLILSLLFADCVPVFLAAPDQGWIGVVHAGWRGTARGIAKRAVELLAAQGIAPAALWAGIGPSIGGCCYEVNETVVHEVGAMMDQPGAGEAVPSSTPGRFQLDLGEVNRRLLREAGLADRRIESAGLCTACHPQWFFSYRRDGVRSGRLGGFICRK